LDTLDPISTNVEIQFEDSPHEPLKVKRGEALSEVLNATNSPVLFGCRTGICGTCVVEVSALNGGQLPDTDFVESESLTLYAPDNPKARLACQLEACTDLRIKRLREKS
jgi:ferredoxin